jgi:pantetheine-phosphate adenylyltransferase
MKVMVGGTFSPLHAGHRVLISRAFEIAGPDGHVTIGLTSDTFAGSKTHPIEPFEERKERLMQFILRSNFVTPYDIEILHDRFGTTLTAHFDALVVSEETYPVAKEINAERHSLQHPCVEVYQISCVLAEDGKWISSTRIWKGEIDIDGKMKHSETEH